MQYCIIFSKTLFDHTHFLVSLSFGIPCDSDLNYLIQSLKSKLWLFVKGLTLWDNEHILALDKCNSNI